MWFYVSVVYLITCLCSPVSTSNVSQCRPHADFTSADGVKIEPILEKYEAGLIMLLGFGGFSVLLAIVYNLIRVYVYHDVNNLDSTFDAGGDVSASLTAVTIAAQLLWPADLMQCVTFAVKYGIGGAFWYCGAAMVNLSLFPLLSFKFKSRAPGAKTFLQIIYARFGRNCHIIYCCFSLLLNVVVISTILVGGIAVMQATIKDVSPEFCLLTIVTLCGSYSLIGGLGSTFYVSYFNALMTFVVLSVLIIKIIYSEDPPFGSLDEIYDRVNCVEGVEGNTDGSRFTFLSRRASIVSVQSVFLVASITYCDQASWQSRIAAKPLQGAIGFLFGAFVWFSVPASIGLVTGLTYVSETAMNASFALSAEQIDSGIVSTYMAQKALGVAGIVMMLTMITMLTMSTGSGEIMGVSAIIIYDIYQTYINPFRSVSSDNECLLCGRDKPSDKDDESFGINCKGDIDDDVCRCPPAVTCEDCKRDIRSMADASQYPGKVVIYQCAHHSMFRTYQDSLINFKNWCLLWVSIGMIPLGLILNRVGIDLNWLMTCGAIMTVPSFPGVIMSVSWVKVTGRGIMTGSLVGFACGITATLLVASFEFNFEGGFIKATSQPYSVLAGTTIGGSISLVLAVVISLCTHDIRTKQDEDQVWERLRNLDNPLHPWAADFAQVFPEVRDGVTRPTQEQLEYIGRAGRLVSIGGSITFFIIFIIVIPASMASLEVLSSSEFKAWTMFITVWLLIAATVIILITPLEEIYNIFKTIRFGKTAASQYEGVREKTKSSQLGESNEQHEYNENSQFEPIRQISSDGKQVTTIF